MTARRAMECYNKGEAMEPNGNEPTQALVVRQPQAIDAYTPRDIGEAMQLARYYAASKILGSAYGTPEAVMLVMATGAELGIPPTAALRGLYVVEGRVFMSADLMVALCLRAPQCARFDMTESTNTQATYTVQRRGEPAAPPFSFSVEDAKRAGLVKEKSNWEKYPAAMCRHRAASIAARAIFPDVIMGLYSEGERDEFEGRHVAEPVQPLPLVAPAQDAEFTDHPPESDEERIIKAFGASTAMQAVDAFRDEALRVWPNGRPDAVKAAHVAAKKRIAAAATAKLVERQPGEEG